MFRSFLVLTSCAIYFRYSLKIKSLSFLFIIIVVVVGVVVVVVVVVRAMKHVWKSQEHLQK